MYKISWISLALLCLIQIPQETKAMKLKEDANCCDIRKQFIKTVNPSKNTEERKIDIQFLKDVGCSGNKGIYEIVEGEKAYIGKVLITLPKPEGTPTEQIATHKHLNEAIHPTFDKSIIDHFNAQVDFPKFVKYAGTFKAKIKGQEENILLLEKALGVSLKKFRETSFQKTLEELTPHLERLGAVLRNFAVSGWSHGDFQPGSDNIFYDENMMTLTLIDYGSLEKKLNPSQAYKICERVLENLRVPEMQKVFFESYIAELPETIQGDIKNSILKKHYHLSELFLNTL